MSKKVYVAGFMFDESLDHVALIEKQHPEWQKGKLNGIGGKVDGIEGVHHAMAREFYEETGHTSYTHDWRLFAVLTGEFGEVNFFSTTGPIRDLKTTTDEHIVVYGLDAITEDNAIPNLTYLVPMARLSQKSWGCKQLRIQEVS